MADIIHRLNRWGRALVRHLPEKPYPSGRPMGTTPRPVTTAGLSALATSDARVREATWRG